MSAAEIIEQIKALSPEEREEVASFFRTEDTNEPAGGSPVRYVSDETFKSVAKSVFEKHDELFKKLAE
jgi:hypothetical protein